MRKLSLDHKMIAEVKKQILRECHIPKALREYIEIKDGVLVIKSKKA